MSLEFRVGGRKVSEQQLARALEDQALKQVDEAVQRKLGGIRCPKHGQRATVKSVRSGRDLKWKVQGCCDELIEAARKALS